MGGLDWRVFCGVYGGDYGVCGGVCGWFSGVVFFCGGCTAGDDGDFAGCGAGFAAGNWRRKIFGEEKAKKACSRCF